MLAGFAAAARLSCGMSVSPGSWPGLTFPVGLVICSRSIRWVLLSAGLQASLLCPCVSLHSCGRAAWPWATRLSVGLCSQPSFSALPPCHRPGPCSVCGPCEGDIELLLAEGGSSQESCCQWLCGGFATTQALFWA